MLLLKLDLKQGKQCSWGDVLKSRCNCTEPVRLGSLQGINFQICTTCSYLQWESVNELSFIRSTFDLELSDFSASCVGLSVAELCSAVETHLGLLSGMSSNVRIEPQHLDLTYRIESVSDEVLIPLLDDFTVWDIRAAESEEEEELYPLLAAKLAEYSTETIIIETLEDMFTEMNDYMQKDEFLKLNHHFSSFSFKGVPVSARITGMNLESPISSANGLVIEPET